jgi:biopolymer transport protein ExbB
MISLLAVSVAGHGNPVIDTFHKGGPVMYPILVVSIVAVAVVLERIFWWSREFARRDNKKLDQVYTSIDKGNIEAASAASAGSNDPRLRTINHGLNRGDSTMLHALQIASGLEVERASRFLVVLDTIVTLAPLLGLLGTVTGIMAAFRAVGEGGLNVDAVSGGIGEALIATACGLGIAICSLLPFNYFNSKVDHLRFELETVSTNLEMMTKSTAIKNETELSAS